ncbi:MAG: 30S ribosomal protein S24e [ANME-2 cluster archaeon]|jgi:ribosomal protein S24E|nr:MAG: 30S ribosomal protein S24e [ANME-2 cluster archaeon]
MAIEIVKDEENVLLNRRNIVFKTEEIGMSRKSAKNTLVALLDTDPKLLILDRMKSQYGRQDILGYARLYDNEQNLRRIEPDYMIARNAPAKENEGGES